MQRQGVARWWDDVREGGPPPVPEGWEPDDWRDDWRDDWPDGWPRVDVDDVGDVGDVADPWLVPAAWSVPGVPLPRAEDRPPALPADVQALLAAVAGVQAADPVLLDGRAALERARLLMSCVERLGAAVLPALRDVDARGLWQHAAASGTRGWLRTLPAGEGAWLTSAALLDGRPHLTEALGDGRLALRTARTVAAALDQVPADVPDEQVVAVVTDGVAGLLRVWLGAACLRPSQEQERTFADRRARLDAAVALGARLPQEAPWVVLPAARLEPVLTLLAEVLAPGDVAGAVRWLLDALLPDRVEERERRDHDRRGLVLQRTPDGGWSLRGRLTETVGQRLQDLLRGYRGRLCAPAEVADGAATLLDLAAELGGAGDDPPFPTTDVPGELEPCGPLAPQPPRYGGVGPGDPALLPPPPEQPWAADVPDQPLLGDPPATPDQRRHDALAALLAAVAGLPPGPGRPAPARLLIKADLTALTRSSNPLPAALDGTAGPVALSGRRLAELACSARLVAVLTDAAGRPVGTSREERDASPAQRDALRAVWGDRCAAFGCPNPGTVPHHVRMHSRHGETVLADLVPVCEGDHHVLHDGKHALRLRDGRVLDEDGWVSAPTATVAPRPEDVRKRDLEDTDSEH